MRLLFQPAEELAQGGVDAGCGGGGGPQRVVWRACGAEPAGGHGGDPAGLSRGGGRRAGNPGAGEGGHGARPHQSVDAVWLAARVITEPKQTIAAAWMLCSRW